MGGAGVVSEMPDPHYSQNLKRRGSDSHYSQNLKRRGSRPLSRRVAPCNFGTGIIPSLSSDDMPEERALFSRSVSSTPETLVHEEHKDDLNHLIVEFRTILGDLVALDYGKTDLGITWANSTPVFVRYVDRGSTSHKLGVEIGWVVIKINGYKVEGFTLACIKEKLSGIPATA